MKKSLKPVFVGVVVAMLAFMMGNSNKVSVPGLGSAFEDRTDIAILGSATNLKSVPSSAVFANSTTTDSSLPDGGDTITQNYTTGGIRKINMHIQALGGTATSTLFVRQMGSFDGTTYFDIATSTADIRSTTTVSLDPRAIQFDPGTATTTGISMSWPIDGYSHTRFIIYGDDATTDPNDGVQAFITATKIRDKE